MRLETRRCKSTGMLIFYVYMLINTAMLIYLYSHRDKFNIVPNSECPQCPRSETRITTDLSIISDNLEFGSNQDVTVRCNTIHLAFICGGHNSTRGLYTLLKSILFYRTNSRLELHIFVDDISQKILKQLFATWIVPDLDVNYYHVSEYEHQISWIPNEHYSQGFGLLKLVAPSILASKGVKQVVFLDTDMLALGDISLLMREMSNLINAPIETFIGIVENQSDWYYQDVASFQSSTSSSRRRRLVASWRAKHRGFNTGLMLIDLVKLKNNNWDQMWRQVAEMELINYLKTTLADQDIINAIIKEHDRIYIELDSRFNIQLNDKSNLSNLEPALAYNRHQEQPQALTNDRSFMLLHWNSPNKLDCKNQFAKYYKIWYETFENWNGKLLERAVCSIDNIEDNEASERTETKTNGIQASSRLERYVHRDCHEIRPRPTDHIRTYIYYLDFKLNDHETSYDKDFEVTLAVHLSLDRIRALDELAANWPGPISVAIYLSESEISLFKESIGHAETLSRRRNIGYHLAFRDYGLNYPINRLRNIALNQTMTPYVYLTDVDFLPAYNLYYYLKEVLGKSTYVIEGGREGKQSEVSSSPEKFAFIVPAFETKEYKFDFPRDKNELISQLDLGTVTKFRDSIWPQGQAATQYDTWKQATKPYEIKWEPDYEPFIVTHKNVPKFDERFTGFGWNKVEHIMQLAASGYKFLVLPEAFAIHQYHAASYDISLHRRSRKYQSCIRNLKELFVSELNRQYPDFFHSNRFTSRY